MKVCQATITDDGCIFPNLLMIVCIYFLNNMVTFKYLVKPKFSW